MAKVRKAVIAAAGFGTRFLPQTKAMPKEMLPLVDKPIIQYVVEDLVYAGIQDIILVTASGKRSVEEHFDSPNQDLVNNLRSGGPDKEHFIRQLEDIANLANFIYVHQKGSYGNARPVMNVRHLIGDEPFIYIFADDVIVPNRFPKMVKLYEELNGAVLPCIKMTTDEEFKRYGVMGGDFIRDGVMKMNTIVEKPGREKAPSDLASVGGYLLTPDIFEYLERMESMAPEGEEFLIQPIFRKMIEDGKQFFACELSDAKYYDTGNKLEYLKTVIDFALLRDDVGPDLMEYLKDKFVK
jgi:UTP--glucose-1-phosphate uridylyltransferase